MALNSPRILVVDDNDAGRYVKVHTLRTSGFAVSEATTGAEAVELTSREGPDLVVLDVKLPDISGIEVCRQVKATFPGTMVLQTSAAFVGAKDRAAGLQGGADSYLIEPIDPPELVAAVRALLRTRHAESELRQLNRQLEQRVAERTGELEQANRRLQAEIEERRRTETALRLAEKMELVGQLTGGIAHDFNNLLTVISGNLELLSEAVSGGKPIDPPRLQRMMGGGAECHEPGRAADPSPAGPVAPRRPAAAAGAHRPHPLGSRGIRQADARRGHFARTVSRTAGLVVPYRPDPVRDGGAEPGGQRARRDAGGRRFAIRTANVTVGGSDRRRIAGFPGDVAAGDYVLLTVSDTGIGMDEDVLERAFEPFFTTKDVGKGSGLGLSQVHSFVTSAGGHIKVESAPGKGTSFHLYLPRSAQEERTAARSSEEAVSIAGGGCETILVVEDDPAVLEVALRTIRGLRL